MLDDITTGNAPIDAQEFRYWFVGNIKKWCKEGKRVFDPKRFQLRNTSDIEFRWGDNKKGEKRIGGWASCTHNTAISILIRGNIIYKFRKPEEPAEIVQYELSSEGDYIMWKEDVEHSWETQEDSVILTVRWKASSPR
jgi:hypothetical protein